MKRIAGVMILSALALGACQKKPQEAATKAQAPAAGAPAASAPAAEAQNAALRRKPGLWEMKMTSAGIAQASRVCVDAATDERTGITGVRKGANPCREHLVTKTAAGWTIDTVCELGDAGVMTNHATLTGDTASHYRVDMTTTTKGAKAAQMNGTRNATLEATWQGPCPADMKPGDVEVGGVKFNAASGG